MTVDASEAAARGARQTSHYAGGPGKWDFQLGSQGDTGRRRRGSSENPASLALIQTSGVSL